MATKQPRCIRPQPRLSPRARGHTRAGAEGGDSRTGNAAGLREESQSSAPSTKRRRPIRRPSCEIGEHVTPGKVLCIIESMKLMNEIEAEVAGVIESKLVQNGQPVEYGEALFGIRPV